MNLFTKSTASSQTCPECGSKLLPDDGSRGHSPHQAGELVCPNPDCPVQVRRNLLHWCSPEVMDIPGGDEKLVALLVERGLARDVAELYRVKVKELAALDGMDKVSAQKFFDAITASMKRDAWRVLFGLNIPLVGAAEAQALGKGFSSVDAVFAVSVPQLMQDAGVSEAAAESIVHWHGDSVNRKLVKRLFKWGVNFKSKLYQAPATGREKC